MVHIKKTKKKTNLMQSYKKFGFTIFPPWPVFPLFYPLDLLEVLS